MDVGKGLVAIGAGLAVFTGLGQGFGEGHVAAQAIESMKFRAIGRNFA